MPNSDGSDGRSFVEEKTEVLYDPNEIVRRAVEEYYNLKYTADTCTDINGPSIFVIPNHPEEVTLLPLEIPTKLPVFVTSISLFTVPLAE